jgi:predicted nucleic acid-binding protein
MNGDSLVVDANIIIYHLNGDRTLEAMLEGKKIFLSFISEIEIKSFQSLTKSQALAIEELLGYCHIIHSNDFITDFTVRLRKKYSIKIPDAIILGTAQYLNMPVLTADKRLLVSKEVRIIWYGQEV